jgi:hypothetical protein
MIDWNAIAKPPHEVPDIMRAASILMHRKKTPQSMRAFEQVLDNEDKYYFSTSEAHALDRRAK